MKKSKWSRLGLGLALLGMLIFFSASSDHPHSICAFCDLEMGSDTGYIQVNNNTPFNIQVIIQGKDLYGPYVIKSNPPYIRAGLTSGNYRVIVLVLTPTPDQTPVLFRTYRNVNVTGNRETTALTVTTPIGYIPIPN